MKRALVTCSVAALAMTAGLARGVQGTSFTYQGQLAQLGTPASGTFDIQFRLYSDSASSVQVGGTMCADNVQVSDGRFTVVLDFGAQFTGDPRFLELAVRSDTGADCSDAAGFTTLNPRQELTGTPYASHAATSAQASQADNAVTLNGQSASFYRDAANLTGTIAPPAIGGTYPNSVAFNNASNVFAGNGLGLMGLNASNMTVGVLDPARMPTNWVAGGDLTGLLPNPSIRPEAVNDSKISDVSWFKVTGVPKSVSSAYSPWSLNQTAVPIGSHPGGASNPPPEPLTAVACGTHFSVGIRPDGSLASWGYGIGSPPAGDFIAVAASRATAAALRRDGSLVGWGELGAYAAPQGNFSAVAVGDRFGVGLRVDGQVVVWGDTAARNLSVPPNFYTKIAAGWDHIVALRSDGTLFACGVNSFGQTNVPSGSYSQVYSCGNHGVAMRSNGTLVHWGDTEYGQISVPTGTYQNVAMTSFGGVAIRADFTTVAWGIFTAGPFSAPGGRFVSGAGGDDFAILISVPSISTTAPVLASGGMNVTGNISASGNLSTTGNIAASGSIVASSGISGNGAGLTNLDASQVTGALPSSALSGTYRGIVWLTNSGNFFAGSGGGLFELNASNITFGYLPDERLSANVAMRNAANTFTTTGITSFAGPVAATAFSGSGTSLTGLDAGAVTTGSLADARLSVNIPRLNAPSNSFTGTLSGNGSGLTSLNAANLASGTVPDARLSANVALLSAASNVFTGTLSGNGSGLTSLNAANLATGTLPDARLSSNVPLLSAASNTFTGSLNGNGSGLTSLNATNLASGTVGDARLSANVAMRNAANAFGNFNNTFAGNVGIGTPTPGAKLDVAGLTRTLALQVGTSANVGQVLTADGSGTGTWQSLPAAGSGLDFAANTYSVEPDGVTPAMLSGDASSLVKITAGGLALLPTGESVDRSQPNTTASNLGDRDVWQSWTPNATGTLTAIAVQLGCYIPSGPSTLSVYSGVGTGGTLLSSQPVTVVSISGGGLQHFQLATPVAVTAGQAYTFKLTSPLITVLSYGAGGTVAGMSSSYGSAINLCFRTFHAGTGTPGLIASGGLTLTGNTIELSRNVTKESNAGKIGYQLFTADALDIVGAGTTGSNRKIKLWAEGGATFTGALSVTGALSKGGGSFKIDHPLDPANKFLYHSFVESPDMMNIYNGTIVTGADGYATVELPDYFEALNRDFRYQLTVIDENAPDLTSARVAHKIGVKGDHSFVIKTMPGNLEVSWQVTGIRHDAWADKNRIPNSVDKSEAEKGKYLHPEAFGLTSDKAIGAAQHAAPAPASN